MTGCYGNSDEDRHFSKQLDDYHDSQERLCCGNAPKNGSKCTICGEEMCDDCENLCENCGENMCKECAIDHSESGGKICVECEGFDE